MEEQSDEAISGKKGEAIFPSPFWGED